MNINTEKLKGTHIYLSLLAEEDKEVIRSLARDPRIWEFNQMLLVNDNYNKMFDDYFNFAMDPNAMNGQYSFVIRQVKDNAIVGMTRLYEISQKDKAATIGYTWYLPEVWGNVYNKECKFLLLRYIFEELGLNRAEFRVAHQNIRSQKAVEKIGGIKEGVLRKHGYRNDGEIRHTVIYSIIDDEWAGVKENLMQMIEQQQQSLTL